GGALRGPPPRFRPRPGPADPRVLRDRGPETPNAWRTSRVGAWPATDTCDVTMLVHCERSGNCFPCPGVASSVDCETGPLSWGGVSGTPIGGHGGPVKVGPGGGSVGGERGGRWWHCKGADRGFLPATPRCAGARECRSSGQ